MVYQKERHVILVSPFPFFFLPYLFLFADWRLIPLSLRFIFQCDGCMCVCMSAAGNSEEKDEARHYGRHIIIIIIIISMSQTISSTIDVKLVFTHAFQTVLLSLKDVGHDSIRIPKAISL